MQFVPCTADIPNLTLFNLYCLVVPDARLTVGVLKLMSKIGLEFKKKEARTVKPLHIISDWNHVFFILDIFKP